MEDPSFSYDFYDSLNCIINDKFYFLILYVNIVISTKHSSGSLLLEVDYIIHKEYFVN